MRLRGTVPLRTGDDSRQSMLPRSCLSSCVCSGLSACVSDSSVSCSGLSAGGDALGIRDDSDNADTCRSLCGSWNVSLSADSDLRGAVLHLRSHALPGHARAASGIRRPLSRRYELLAVVSCTANGSASPALR